METGNPFKPSTSFQPAYRESKVDMACSLSPKFEKEIVVAKLAGEPEMTKEGPAHKEMNRRFQVVAPSLEGANITAKTTGVPRGAVPIKLKGLEEASALLPQSAPSAVKPEVLEEVVLVPSEVSDSKVLERIERMMSAERRNRDLEDENRVLTKTIARLQGEIDSLKGSAGK